MTLTPDESTYLKDIVLPSMRHGSGTSPSTLRLSAEIVDRNAAELREIFNDLNIGTADPDEVYAIFAARIQRDFSKTLNNLSLQDGDEQIHIPWGELSELEQNIVFLGYAKQHTELLATIAKMKESEKLTKSDIDRHVYGHNLELMRECWKIARGNDNFSTHDFIRMFTRSKDPLANIRRYQEAQEHATQQGLSRLETRELFLRSGAEGYIGIVDNFKKLKSVAVAAGVPEKLAGIIIARTAKDNVDASIVSVASSFVAARKVLEEIRVQAIQDRGTAEGLPTVDEALDAAFSDVIYNGTVALEVSKELGSPEKREKGEREFTDVITRKAGSLVDGSLSIEEFGNQGKSSYPAFAGRAHLAAQRETADSLLLR